MMTSSYYYSHDTGSGSSTASCDNMYDNYVNDFKDHKQLVTANSNYAC